MSEKIRLLLTDDHAMVREGLRALLNAEPDMEVVGEASNGEEAIGLVAQLRPDVVLMDISMPMMDGITATRSVKAAAPGTKVLVLTMHAEEKHLLPVIEAGGSGYVLKSATHSDLTTAIRTVFRGDVFLYPKATSMLLKHYLNQVQTGQERENFEKLSPREREVLQMVAEGHSSAEIAQRLFLSPKTVDTYRDRIAEKLGMRRRADLVRYALKVGLLKASDL